MARDRFLADGTKVVRRKVSISIELDFQGVGLKLVQSIMGAAERRRERDRGVTRFEGIGIWDG